MTKTNQIMLQNFLRTHILAIALASWSSLTAIALDPTPPLAEGYLHQGKLAEGETALLLALDANPQDDVARFGLGVTQFFRAIENLGKALYEYGAVSDNTSLPFLRLPVPRNDNPSSVSFRELGRVLDVFSADLSRAEATLASVKDDNVKLSLRLSNIQFDFTGTGDQRVKLIDVLQKLNSGRRFDFQKDNPDFRIHFDRGDVAWLRAYCQLLSAMVNCYRAIDEEAGFESRVKSIFPKIEVSSTAAARNWIDGLRVVDPPRLRRARIQLLAVCELNQETWKHIRLETDDDFEWLSNSKQTDQLGLPISDRQTTAWLSMLTELAQLLEGQSLIPAELLVFVDSQHSYAGRGLNVKRLLDDPPTDMLNMKRINEKGIDAKYLEDEKGKKPFNLAMLLQSTQMFEGPFAFARAARLN